jgi:hypothetical protein
MLKSFLNCAGRKPFLTSASGLAAVIYATLLFAL